MPTEAWLRGPVAGLDAFLQPAAHALVQVREDLGQAVADLRGEQIWARPGGAASVGFHLRHLAGATDRLLTYARGEQLSDEQRNFAAREGLEGPEQETAALVAAAVASIDAVLDEMKALPRERLLDDRKVGRARLPSTVLGLLFHIAEHAARHLGQVVTTAKVVRAA